MKKILLSAALIAVSFTSFAQVGIGTVSPNGALDVTSTTAGLVLPRVANVAAVTNPQGGAIVNGTMVYDVLNTCVRAYENNTWTDCLSGTKPLLVAGQNNTVWMDRNLGATMVSDQPRSAFTSDAAYIASQKDSFGDYYQWGRAADGHQLSTSATTATPATTASAGHGDFITVSGFGDTNWTSFEATNAASAMTLWQGITGVNNPCPTGFRIPTGVELDNERSAFATNNTAGAASSALKLPAAGNRRSSDGAPNGSGRGYYWSSTISIARTSYLYFDDGSSTVGRSTRSSGYPVRCIQN